jgi:lipid-A-disaccharide synthase-like uncharacterized protein
VRLKSGKRIKWEPAALMLFVLGMGFWLALGPSGPEVRPGANKLEVKIGEMRGVLEAMPGAGPGGEPVFRLLLKGQPPSRDISAQEAREIFGEPVFRAAVDRRRNWVFRLLNITTWVNLVWIAIGLTGQLLFSGRMFLQWLVSERKRQSVITESFWWFSLLGAVALFSYSVWRQDPVYILGQASGIVIYARNLRLIYKHKRRAARAAVPQAMPPE